jgi:hypothetical protein
MDKFTSPWVNAINIYLVEIMTLLPLLSGSWALWIKVSDVSECLGRQILVAKSITSALKAFPKTIRTSFYLDYWAV